MTLDPFVTQQSIVSFSAESLFGLLSQATELESLQLSLENSVKGEALTQGPLWNEARLASALDDEDEEEDSDVEDDDLDEDEEDLEDEDDEEDLEDEDALDDEDEYSDDEDEEEEDEEEE